MIDELWDRGESDRHAAILDLLHDAEKHAHCRLRERREDDGDLSRCLRAAAALRDGIQNGALHKGTVQILAFI